MTGNVGRPGSALLPLRGQNNVQGSSDMGALPDTYTAYRSVGDEEVARSLRGRVGRAALAREGLHDPADVRRRGRRRPEGDVHLRRGRRADRPEHRATSSTALESLEFLVCQDIFETETTKYADVILPASRVPREGRARSPTPSGASSSSTPAIDPPGERARPTSRSSRTVSRALGHEMGCTRRPRTRWTRSRR